MYFGRFVSFCLMFWTARNLAEAKNQEMQLLQKAMSALYNGLQYMEDHVTEINLDGAFGCRLVQGMFDAFLAAKPLTDKKLGRYFREHLKMLSEKADKIAYEAKYYIKLLDPEYYEDFGGLLDRGEKLLWYPDRLTQSSLVVQPLSCTESDFNDTFSDTCLKKLIDSRSNKLEMCDVSENCFEFMTRPRQRGYIITHQVLYFEMMEMGNCVERSRVKEIPEVLQDTLCSNVMRDANEIAARRYPLGHRDLFMEQIGLCSLWGYKEFHQLNWITEILQWQQTSGCYANEAEWRCTDNLIEQHIRRKREEKNLADGCLSHKTSVALLAIAANIRFIAEKISEMD